MTNKYKVPPQIKVRVKSANEIGNGKKAFLSRRTAGDVIFDTVNFIIMIVFTITMLYPLLNTVAVSFNDGTDARRGGIHLWPRMFTFDNYKAVLRRDLMPTAAKISVLRTVIGTVSSTFVTALLAYVLSRKNFIFKKQLSLIYVITMYVSGGLIPVFLGFAVMSAMTGKRMVEKMRQYGNALAAMCLEAVEYVRGIPVVKTFGQSVFSFKKFKGAIDNYERWVIAYTKQMRWPMTFYTLAVNSVFVFLIAGGFLFSRGGADGGVLLNLLFYIIITPVISLTLTKLMFMSENGMIVQDAITRIDSVLQSPALSQPEVPQHPKDSSVTLDHVTFSYDGTKNALEDVSLSIGSGQTVAFVGPSGGGKSTLAALIARFFDPQSGSISIGGINVKNIDKNELMDTVSFVFQNSHLIKGSILDNIRMGKTDATDEEVLAALRAAQCMDIIEKFPDGVHTIIGSQGIYLSGGETQRLAIARAMLKNAPVLILDEATAFADPDNETKVQVAFNALAKGRTVIMIAHRLSTVVNADHIYVLKDGHLAEDGSFADLSERMGSLFGTMWRDYQQSVQWKVAKEA